MKNFNENFWVNALFAGSLTGTLGFALGFFGPMVFGSMSNSEVPANLLFTGSFGFIAGFVFGALFHSLKLFKKQS